MIKSVITDYGIVNFEYKVAKSNKITIKIKNDGSVRVLAPAIVNYSRVENFVKSRAKWVVTNSQKYKQKFETLANSSFDSIYIFGQNYPIIYCDCEKVKISFFNNNIYLFGNREKVLKKFKKTLFNFAKDYLFERFNIIKNELEIKDEIAFAVKNVKTWWGSYNAKNKMIKLSFRLITRDKACIDSVIYHEFAHCKVLNHQKEFYKVLLTYCPQYYTLKKALKDSKFDISDKFILDK